MTDFFVWANPDALKYLWLVPGIALLHWWAANRRHAALTRFCPEETAGRLGLRSVRRRRAFSSVLFAAGIGFVVVALAQPQVGTTREKAQRRGAEIVLAVDTSSSMGATDLEPNRLNAAKEAAATLIGRLPGDRFGIVLFAGDAYKYCPLTIDHDAARMFLDSISLDSAPQPGTALAKAITISAEMIEEAHGKHRAVVLLTDGEDHEAGALEAVNRLNRETAAVVMVLGVGTPEGEAIPVRDAAGSVRDYKRDRAGKVVISKLHEQQLQELAKAGNGFYRRLSEPEALAHITRRLESLEGIQVGTYNYTGYAERFQWPLLIGLLLIVAALLIPHQTPRLRRRPDVPEA
ncbi:MAG: VWA domain-containing protein [Armatimonadota bacterium]